MTERLLTTKIEGNALTRQRLMLIAVAGLFVLPVVGAWLMFQYVEQAGPPATMNHGELIVPARPLQPLDLVSSADATPLDADFLKGKWTFVLLSPGPCEAECRRNLYHTRQIRTALNQYTGRLQRLIVLRESAPAALLLELRNDHPKLSIAGGSVAQWDAFASQFPEVSTPENTAEQPFYLVDPLGNLMMRYDPTLEPKRILKDLQRLMKTSQVG